MAMATLVGTPTDIDAVEMLFTSLLIQATRAMAEAGAVRPGRAPVGGPPVNPAEGVRPSAEADRATLLRLLAELTDLHAPARPEAEG